MHSTTGSVWDLFHDNINLDPINQSRLVVRFFYDLPDQSGSFTLGNNEQYFTEGAA
jgi:hypothetical protein